MSLLPFPSLLIFYLFFYLFFEKLYYHTEKSNSCLLHSIKLKNNKHSVRCAFMHWLHINCTMLFSYSREIFYAARNASSVMLTAELLLPDFTHWMCCAWPFVSVVRLSKYSRDLFGARWQLATALSVPILFIRTKKMAFDVAHMYRFSIKAAVH